MITESPADIEARANEILEAGETLERVRAVVRKWRERLASQPRTVLPSAYDSGVRHVVEDVEAALGEVK